MRQTFMRTKLLALSRAENKTNIAPIVPCASFRLAREAASLASLYFRILWRASVDNRTYVTNVWKMHSPFVVYVSCASSNQLTRTLFLAHITRDILLTASLRVVGA